MVVSELRPGYERCVKCGTYHSRKAPQPEELYTADYWTPENGHSTLDDQVHNVDVHQENGQTKTQAILEQIECNRGSVLEIGCAPGIMLRRLIESGFSDVWGIDIAQEWEPSIMGNAGFPVALMFGVFPEVTKGKPGRRFDLIVACDVWEHSHKPWPFLAECARLLKPDGQLIIMAPLVVNGEELPHRMFNPTEHVFLHSYGNAVALLSQAGFDRIKLSKWCDGHEILSGRVNASHTSGLVAA